MSLMSISQSTSTAYATSTNPLDSVVSSVLADDGVTSTSSSSSDSSSVSGPGAMMKELGDLAKSDPATFKQVTADVAKKLKAEAQSTSDPGKAKMLEKMADSFEKASETGDASDLRPTKPPGGGSGASSGASAYQSAAQYQSGDSQASLQTTLLAALTATASSSASTST